MDVKGQGSLEYLLIIGGAVLVAAVVLAVITGLVQQQQTTERTLEAYCAAYPTQARCESSDPDGAAATYCAGHCQWVAVAGQPAYCGADYTNTCT